MSAIRSDTPLAPDLHDRLGRDRIRRPDRLVFDPVRVGTLECDAWVAYYRRAWGRFLRDGVRVARECFGLSWPETLACAWLVMQANRQWAPYPVNDPSGALRSMTRFYRIVRRRCGVPLDPERAAELDVAWWALHREINHIAIPSPEARLTDAIARLWAHVYGLPAGTVREAARLRAEAMRCTDRWLAGGAAPDSTLIDASREALVASYRELARAVAA